MVKRKADLWLGSVLVALAVAWLAAIDLTVPTTNVPGTPGPQAFPILLGISLLILGTWLIIATLLAGPHSRTSAEKLAPVTRREIQIVAAGFGLLLVWGFAMDQIGFLLATPPMVAVTLRWFLKENNWRKILINSVGLTLGTYVVFELLLKANLPHGNWIQIF